MRIETKPRSGPIPTSVTDVNEKLRQAQAALNESTRKMNLVSAKTLKTYLALHPHEQLAKIFDRQLTRIDRRRLIGAIRDALPKLSFGRSPAGPNNMKGRTMFVLRNTPIVTISAVFLLAIGYVAVQAWRNTARVVIFPELPLVLAMPGGSFRSVVVPSGRALSVIEHNSGPATVRIWQNKSGYATAKVQLKSQ